MHVRIAITVGVVCTALAGCGGTSASTAPSTSTVVDTGCNVAPGPDYLVRSVFPGTPPVTGVLGDNDLVDCRPVPETFVQGAGQDPGECTTLALSSDNPGYDLNAPNPPPLQHVIQSAGPGCSPPS